VGLTVALGIAVAFLWGVPGVWLARATRDVGPLAVIVGSTLIGGIVVAPAALLVGVPEFTARGLALSVATGALTFLGFLASFSAFQHGKVSTVTPIVACQGAVVAGIAIAFGERLDPIVLVMLPLLVLGVVLAGMGASGGGPSGVSRAALAALIYSGVLLLAAAAATEMGPIWAFLIARVTTFAIAFAVAAARGVATASRRTWRNVLVWGIGESLGTLLYFVAAERGPVALASVLAAQFATTGVIAGFVLLKERPLPRQWAGIGIVIVGVTVVSAATAL